MASRKLLSVSTGLFFASVSPVICQDAFLATDPCRNPYLSIERATSQSYLEASTLVNVFFDREVDFPDNCVHQLFGTEQVPIDPLHAGSMVDLQDLNGDGKLDLVLGAMGKISRYLNNAPVDSGKLDLSDNPSVLVNVGIWDVKQELDYRPEEVGDIELKRTDGFSKADRGPFFTFAHLNDDLFVDLVCRYGVNGHLSYFEGIEPDRFQRAQFSDQQKLLSYRKTVNGEVFAGIEFGQTNGEAPSQTGQGISATASPVFLDYDGDDNLDLILPNTKTTNAGPKTELLLYRGLNSPHSSKDIPYFDAGTPLLEKETNLPLEVNTYGAYFYGATLTPSLIDCNRDGFKDLLIHDQVGQLVFFPASRDSQSGLVSFGAGRNLWPSTTNNSIGSLSPQGSIAVGKAVDFNNDGFPDIIQSDRASEGAASLNYHLRQKVALYLSQNDVISRNGERISNSKQPFTFGGIEPYRWAAGDLNDDGKVDLVIANSQSPEVSICLSVDTGDTFDPHFATPTPLYKRTLSFSYKFSIRNLRESVYPYRNEAPWLLNIAPATADLNGKPGLQESDLIVLGLKGAVVAAPLTDSINGECVSVGQFHNMTAGLRIPGVDLKNYSFEIAFGNFSGNLKGSVNGAVLILQPELPTEPSLIYLCEVRTINDQLYLSKDPRLLFDGFETSPFPSEDFPNPAPGENRLRKPVLVERLVDNNLFLGSDEEVIRKPILDLVVSGAHGTAFRFKNVIKTVHQITDPEQTFFGQFDAPALIELETGALRLASGSSFGVLDPENNYLLAAGGSAPAELFTLTEGSFGSISVDPVSPSRQPALTQILASRAHVVGPRHVSLVIPYRMGLSDGLTINRVLVESVRGGDRKPCSFACVPVSSADWDLDGLPDEWELANGFDPNNPDQNENGIPDGEEDFDGDGLTNAQEAHLGTSHDNVDTDGDGFLDSEEVQGTTDPTISDTSVTIDSPFAVLTPFQ